MPTFGKAGGFAAKFMSKSPFSKTIAKDAGIPPIEEEDDNKKLMNKKENMKDPDWTPAFEGADHSQKELDQMTEKEKEDYYN
tara:strand:+ start:373 stop:618 length:246 start_codon:yes stop_codon:yes gene_type:complete